MERRFVEEGARGQLGAEEQVLLDGHIGHEAELLEDRADALLTGVVHGPEVRGRAPEPHLALVGLQRARDDVDEGRLAGAIFAEEHVDFSGEQVEIDVIESLHAGKPLAQCAQAEQGWGSGAALRSPTDLGVDQRQRRSLVDAEGRLEVRRRE